MQHHIGLVFFLLSGILLSAQSEAPTGIDVLFSGKTEKAELYFQDASGEIVLSAIATKKKAQIFPNLSSDQAYRVSYTYDGKCLHSLPSPVNLDKLGNWRVAGVPKYSVVIIPDTSFRDPLDGNIYHKKLLEEPRRVEVEVTGIPENAPWNAEAFKNGLQLVAHQNWQPFQVKLHERFNRIYVIEREQEKQRKIVCELRYLPPNEELFLKSDTMGQMYPLSGKISIPLQKQLLIMVDKEMGVSKLRDIRFSLAKNALINCLQQNSAAQWESCRRVSLCFFNSVFDPKTDVFCDISNYPVISKLRGYRLSTEALSQLEDISKYVETPNIFAPADNSQKILLLITEGDLALRQEHIKLVKEYLETEKIWLAILQIGERDLNEKFKPCYFVNIPWQDNLKDFALQDKLQEVFQNLKLRREN